MTTPLGSFLSSILDDRRRSACDDVKIVPDNAKTFNVIDGPMNQSLSSNYPSPCSLKKVGSYASPIVQGKKISRWETGSSSSLNAVVVPSLVRSKPEIPPGKSVISDMKCSNTISSLDFGRSKRLRFLDAQTQPIPCSQKNEDWSIPSSTRFTTELNTCDWPIADMIPHHLSASKLVVDEINVGPLKEVKSHARRSHDEDHAMPSLIRFTTELPTCEQPTIADTPRRGMSHLLAEKNFRSMETEAQSRTPSMPMTRTTVKDWEMGMHKDTDPRSSKGSLKSFPRSFSYDTIPKIPTPSSRRPERSPSVPLSTKVQTTSGVIDKVQDLIKDEQE